MTTILSSDNIAARVNERATVTKTTSSNILMKGESYGDNIISVWPVGSSGYGTRYTPPTTTAISGMTDVEGIDATPLSDSIAVGTFSSTSSLHLVGWHFSLLTGFGSQYSDPSVAMTTQVRNIRFSNAGDYIGVAKSYNAVPTSVYPWSSSSGFGTKMTDAAATYDDSKGVIFSPSDTFIASSMQASPYIAVYPWSSSGFGTKVTNPGTALPGQAYYAPSFSPDEAYLAVSTGASPFVNVYAWSSSGFGTKVTDPASLPAHLAEVVFSPLGDVIAYGGTVYPWASGTFGTAFTAASELSGKSESYTTFSKDGKMLSVFVFSGYSVYTWPWSYSSGFGTVLSAPSPTPSAGDSLRFGGTLSSTTTDVYSVTDVDNISADITETGYSTLVSHITSSDSLSTVIAEGNKYPFYTESVDILARPQNSSPMVAVWPMSPTTGFGTVYSSSPAASSSLLSVNLSNANDAVGYAGFGSPYGAVYGFSIASGFGTKFADAAAPLTGAGRSINFSKDGQYVGITQDGSPWIFVYPWSSSSGFGTKLTNPSVLPSYNYVEDIVFSAASDLVAIAISYLPNALVYPLSGAGFGTAFTGPSSAIDGGSYGLAFSPDTTAIGFSTGASPWIRVYGWSGSGFGTQALDPATTPTSYGIVIKFSPSGDAVAVAYYDNGALAVYPWSGTAFGTKFSAPASPLVSFGRGVDFSKSGNLMSVDTLGGTYLYVYHWDIASGFGTKIASPSPAPLNQSGNGSRFGGIYDITYNVSDADNLSVSTVESASVAIVPAFSKYGSDNLTLSVAEDLVAVTQLTTSYLYPGDSASTALAETTNVTVVNTPTSNDSLTISVSEATSITPIAATVKTDADTFVVAMSEIQIFVTSPYPNFATVTYEKSAYLGSDNPFCTISFTFTCPQDTDPDAVAYSIYTQPGRKGDVLLSGTATNGVPVERILTYDTPGIVKGLTNIYIVGSDPTDGQGAEAVVQIAVA